MTATESKRGTYTSLNEAPTTQAAATINAIKDYILQAHLKPGDPLPTEARLCADLGVSRSSVREAVRTLVALDIVQVRHGYGMFVGQVSMRPMIESLVFRGLLKPGDDYRSLRDVVEVRTLLDSALADEVIAAWHGREDRRIDEVVIEMERLADAGSTFTEQDRIFHAMLLKPLPNQLFRHLIDAFWTVHTLTVPMLDAPHPEDIRLTANAHRAMLSAARKGDVDAYRAAISDHYAPLLRVLEAG